MQVRVDHVHKNLGGQPVLTDIDLSLHERELVALVGPSGSGKTTLLSIIAGLMPADRGAVVLGGRPLAELPLRERGIGFVFQNYALFEHMSVADNIGFGLQVRKRPAAEVRARVAELLALVQLDGLGARLPRELSGGQRQRVALARALAPNPRLLLLDEPFGALDAQVRAELRGWLRRLHHELPITSVFVTHDREEALELADRLVVLHQGRVQQIGTPDEVLDQPANAFVLQFLDEVEVLDGRFEGERGQFGPFALAGRGRAGTPAQALIRRRDLVLARSNAGAAGGSWADAEIVAARRLGGQVRVDLQLDRVDRLLTAELGVDRWRELGARAGEHVVVVVRESRVFEAAA